MTEQLVGSVVTAEIVLADRGAFSIDRIDTVVGANPEPSATIKGKRLDATLVHVPCKELFVLLFLKVLQRGHIQASTISANPDPSLGVLTKSRDDMRQGVALAIDIELALIGSLPEMALVIVERHGYP